MRRISPTFLYLSFFATGMATVLTGALAGQHGAGSALDDRDIGRMLAAQFGGQLTGAFFVGKRLYSRLMLGACLTAGAAFVLAFREQLSWGVLFIYGVGLGLSMAAINTLAGLESPPDLRTRRLEVLNVFWPVGAALCPWIILRVPLPSPRADAFTCIGVLFLLIAGGVTLRDKAVLNASLVQEVTASPSRIGTLSLLALLAVGVESGLANWLPSFQLRYLGAANLFLPLATIFWFSVLASRLLAAGWTHGNRQRRMIQGGALLCALGSLGLASLQTPWLLCLCTLLAGAAIGPIYPALLQEVVLLRRRGIVFFTAAVGSALFPWMLGRLSSQHQSLRLALWLPALASLMLLAAYSLGPGKRERGTA